MSDSFCPLPWMQVSVKPSGVLTTCCVMRPIVKTSSDNELKIQKDMKEGKMKYSRRWWENNDSVYICGKDSMVDILNSDTLKEVRLDMLAGKRHKACATCWGRERYSKGKISVRVRVRKAWDGRIDPETVKDITGEDGTLKKIDIKNIELRFGNHCNLKCVMCHPGHSNSWYEDWNTLSKMDTFWTDDGSDANSFLFGGVYYDMVDDTPFKWYKTQQFKDDFNKIYKGLNEIYWAGGEPLLCKEHFEILDLLIDSGVSKNMRMRYDSNITYIPEKLIERWNHFKWIGIQASVDDVGIRNEYIRYPSKWTKIEENLKRLDLEGIAYSGTTISCYNILTFLEFAKWAKRNMTNKFWEVMHFKHVIAPFHLCPNVLPKYVKERAIELIDNHLRSDDSPDEESMHYVKADMFKNYLIEELDFFDEEFYQGFLQHTRNLDKIRPIKFKDCLPELYQMIRRDYDAVC